MDTRHHAADEEGAVLFYDADCRSCRLLARLAVAADTRRRLRTSTLDSAEADRALAGLPSEVRYGAFHLLSGGGVRTGAEAIQPLLELLPATAPLARRLARSPTARRVAGALYEGLARRRGLVSRLLPPLGPPPR